MTNKQNFPVQLKIWELDNDLNLAQFRSSFIIQFKHKNRSQFNVDGFSEQPSKIEVIR